jgi:hypothetical protein
VIGLGGVVIGLGVAVIGLGGAVIGLGGTDSKGTEYLEFTGASKVEVNLIIQPYSVK